MCRCGCDCDCDDWCCRLWWWWWWWWCYRKVVEMVNTILYVCRVCTCQLAFAITATTPTREFTREARLSICAVVAHAPVVRMATATFVSSACYFVYGTIESSRCSNTFVKRDVARAFRLSRIAIRVRRTQEVPGVQGVPLLQCWWQRSA